MTGPAILETDPLLQALDRDELPTVFASTLAHWPREGDLLFLTFAEGRPLATDIASKRAVPVARLCVPFGNLEAILAMLTSAAAPPLDATTTGAAGLN